MITKAGPIPTFPNGEGHQHTAQIAEHFLFVWICNVVDVEEQKVWDCNEVPLFPYWGKRRR